MQFCKEVLLLNRSN